jgi:hypothetical protein
MDTGKIKWALGLGIAICWILLAVTIYAQNAQVTSQQINITENNSPSGSSVIEQVFNPGVVPRASPCDRIAESQIKVYDDKVVIEFKDAQWAKFTDTHSMEPVISSKSNAIEFVPQSEKDICVGDIASYSSGYADGTIIHRVVETGYDDEGWYALFKGDNVPYKDPGKVRFSQIRRVVVGIIY